MFIKRYKIILINDTTTLYGGAETYMFSLKRLLEEMECQVEVIGSSGQVSLKNSFFSRWYSRKYFNIVNKTINDFKPDIIHVQSFSRVLSPSILVAADFFNIPVIQTVHDYHYICPKLWMINDKNEVIREHSSFTDCLFHHLPKNNLVYSFFQATKAEYHKRFLNKYVDHFICPSKDLADWYSERYGADKVTYLPNFVDVTPSNVISSSNTDKLLYVGRLSKEKGIDLLITALPIVLKKYPNINLTIIGSGSEQDFLVRLCKKLNVSDKVSFIGKTNNNDLKKYYQKATAIVIPSIWIENCPMVALEAIRAERPIIASGAGGLKDIIKDKFNGLLFERGNDKDLADKLITLLSDKQLIRNLSKNQKKISYKYEGQYHYNNIIKLYEKLIQ